MIIEIPLFNQLKLRSTWHICLVLFLFMHSAVKSQCIEGNCENGKGHYFYEEDSSFYIGQFKRSEPHGYGVYHYSDGSDYEGYWKAGKREGKGKYTSIKGFVYEGDWVDDEYHGQGKYTYTNGSTYVGSFAHDNFDGEGIYTSINGKVKKGIFKADTLFKGEVYYTENHVKLTPFTGDTNSTLIIDAAGIIDDLTKDSISKLLWAEYYKTTNTIFVLIIPSLDGRILESYANEKFNSLKLGSAERNNGVLLVVAVKDRKMRIEVGYGLEGTLPDLLTQQIQQQEMIPYFKENRMSEGVLSGVKAIVRAINERDYAAKLSSVSSGKKRWGYSVLLTLLVPLVFLIYHAYFGKFLRLIFALIGNSFFIILYWKVFVSWGMSDAGYFIAYFICFFVIYISFRLLAAGKIKPKKDQSWIAAFFEQNSTKIDYSYSSGGSTYSSGGSSYRSSSGSSSWSGGGSSGGGGSSSSW